MRELPFDDAVVVAVVIDDDSTAYLAAIQL